MGYLGLTPTTAQQTYLNVDDISGSFNGSTTSFALLVGGVAPSPFPVTNSCLISVGGVVQRPDDSGTEGFRISGGNIIFSSAPGTGEDFFGVVLAGADYLNVGANFPDGTVGVPSITFQADTDTGIYRGGSGIVSVASNGVAAGSFSSTGFSAVAGTVGAPAISTITDTNTGIYFPAADNIGFVKGGVEALRIDSSGRVGIGATSVQAKFHVSNGGAQGLETDWDGSSFWYLQAYNRSSSSYIPLQINGSDLRWGINGSEKARIDSSGRLLFGTTTAPTVGDSQYALISIQGNTTGSTGDSFLSFRRGQTPGNIASGAGLGTIVFGASDGSPYATINGNTDSTGNGGSSYPGRLSFHTTASGTTTPTERMRIRTDGNVGIGQNGNSIVRLAVSGQSTTGSDYALAVYNSSTQDLFALRNDGLIYTGTRTASPYNNTTGAASNVYVDSNGALYRSTSSIRFKTAVETLDNQYADALLSCRPVWYRSTAPGDALHPDWGYWGFIAEEVAEIDPRLVFWKTHETEKDEDGNTVQVELEEPIAEGVQYDRFVPHLLNLIKRQGEAIAELQAEVAALKGA